MTQHAYPKRRDLTALAALLIPWNAGIQASIDEYHQHPFSGCPHGGSCTRSFRRRKAAAR